MCLVYAPVAQWIECITTNYTMRVQFLLGAPNYVEHSSVGRTPVCGTGGREFNPHCSTSFIKTFTAIIDKIICCNFYIFKMSCSKVYSFLLLDWHKCVGPFLFERRKI